MKNLVIVESPTKAKTIGKFLGPDYQIKASMGHLMDLPKSKLGVDIEKEYTPEYELMKEKKKTISELKQASKDAERIILATDPDREGEAIAAHINEILKLKANQAKRIVFHEITKEAVENALNNPRGINENLVDAQTARRVLDRLVGYKLSPILWKKVRRGLSAGRVQSIALRLIVEREREIENFKSEKYFTFSVFVNKNNKEVEFELISIKGEKIEKQEAIKLYDGTYKVGKTTISDSSKAKKIDKEIEESVFAVSDVVKKETRRSPSAAFITSTLQQEASRRFGFSGKRTMSLAQKLYEEGLITYHRTDSVTVSTQAISSIRSYIEKEFGKKYLPGSPRIFKTKQKTAQEAHEAIRPTQISVSPEKVHNELGRDYAKVYEIIWKRMVASQMADALIESTNIFAVSENNEYEMKASGSVLMFDGFLKINPQALTDRILPDFKKDEKIRADRVDQVEHETTPPPRYNDASLVASLEEEGIGRPSTYATIISTIESRKYIERNEGRFIPTSVGVAVNDFLVKNFSTVDDIPFTAQMENELDLIANGEKKWKPVIEGFYKPFEKDLKNAEDVSRVKIEVEETSETCPKCGANLVIRMGRFGKFLSCSTFPKCDFTKAFVEETDLNCPECGNKIIIKRTRKGRRFYGCSNYPKCKFAAWKIEDIKKKSQ